MANPLPTIVFSVNVQQQLATETVGPAYAAKEVGHMNVNSGQSVPVQGGGLPTTQFGNSPADQPLAQLNVQQFFLQAASGRLVSNRGKGRSSTNAHPYTAHAPVNDNGTLRGATDGMMMVLNNINVGPTNLSTIMSQNADYGTTVVNGVTCPTFTLYGSNAIDVREMFCDPDARDQQGTKTRRFSGAATPDRNWLNVISFQGDTTGTST